MCESHPGKPWDGNYACGCGEAGIPCPKCNHSTGRHDPPRDPAGFTPLSGSPCFKSVTKRGPVIVYLREIDPDTDNACWVVCAECDSGAVAFTNVIPGKKE